MRVLVFGNPLVEKDTAALKIAKLLEGKVPGIEFVRFDTAEDLERQGSELAILDAVVGLEEPRLISLDELEVQKAFSLHDFDLGWNLLLLKKLGRISKVTIIGVPAKKSAKGSLDAVKKLLLALP